MAMKGLSLILLSVPAVAFATAGFAERHHEFEDWMFPAYKYCLIFGVISFLLLILISWFRRRRTQIVVLKISDFFICHKSMAIIFTGILMAISMGLVGIILWKTFWILALIPFMILWVTFPFCLVNRNFRENRLLSPIWIKWALMIAISSIATAVLFIVFTNYHLLPDAEGIYSSPSIERSRYHFGQYLTHPYDSLIQIWIMTFLFIPEIFISLILYWSGVVSRKILTNRKYRSEAEDELTLLSDGSSSCQDKQPTNKNKE